MTLVSDSSLISRLDRFARSNTPGVWNHLDKQQIVQDLQARIENPFKIEQGEQPFCGPAAVVFELIRKQPHRYLDICQSLYERGSFDGYTKPIVAAGRLRRSYGNLRMAQADWMLLATLRDSANLIVPVHPKAPELIRNIAGITKPWEINVWVQELLGYPEVITQQCLSGEFQALQEAERIVANGGVAFGLINSQGLLGINTFFAARLHRLYPSHWVTILGNLSIESPTRTSRRKQSRVEFDIYSWGRKIRVNTDAGSIGDYFWGVVSGEGG
jgi:hypothetical protein